MRGSGSRRSAAPFFFHAERRLNVVNAYYNSDGTWTRIERQPDGEWCHTSGFSSREAALKGQEDE